MGARILVPGDSDFPALLSVIPDPPPVLFILGDATLLELPAVAVVGSRDHTLYGAEVCRALTRVAAEMGIVVVSGMARGLDAAAHAGALEAGGATIGVLGNGLGVVYPAANRQLYERVGSHGLLITEFPPGERPHAGSFPQRNRLISGLARVTVVVEAAAGSGALITASAALDQGREVLAVPGPVTSSVSVGANRLIRDGAGPYLEPIDLLQHYPDVTSHVRVVEAARSTARLLPDTLSVDEREVALMLDGALVHIDELAARSGKPVSSVLALLSSLEIAGVAEQHPGRHFAGGRSSLRFPTCTSTYTSPSAPGAAVTATSRSRFDARSPRTTSSRQWSRNGGSGKPIRHGTTRRSSTPSTSAAGRRRTSIRPPSVVSFPESASTARSRLVPKLRSRPIPTTSPPQPPALGVRPGINRISLGVQSFAPEALAWMHRTHDAERIPLAVAQIRESGITDLSLDLIFGLPATLDRCWETDLERAIGLGPEHLSLYGLTVEEHTPLGRWTREGKVTPVDEDRYATEFLFAHKALLAAGYDHYEVSNAARPGHRARHNSAYWRRAPFIGLGPSAHSGFGLERRWNLRDWQAYHEAAAAGRSLIAGHEVLGGEAVALEETYLGLRTREGLAGSSVPKP